MRTAVGLFDSHERAENAFAELRQLGFTDENLTLLSPGSDDVAFVEDMGREGSRMRKALGGVVGGVMGGTGGGMMGAAVASFFAPGVGPVLALGFVAAAVAAVGGAVVGVEVGDELDRVLHASLPREELFFYEEALRRGRTVVVGVSEDERQLEAARRLLADTGAETLESARSQWWTGVHDSDAAGTDTAEETLYRQGFEAALEPGARGRSYEEALDYLKAHHPELWERDAFREGFARGQAYYKSLASDS